MFDSAIRLETQRIRVELTHMLASLCGGPHFDKTPRQSPGTVSATTEGGAWFKAAVSGHVQIPYIGELARAGKFPHFARTIDRVEQAVRKHSELRQLLRDELRMIRAALYWMPREGNSLLAAIQQRAATLAEPGGIDPLPDIAPQLNLPGRQVTRGRIQLVASGRLGVPGLVRKHRVNRQIREKVRAACPGYQAGHLLGDQFGAPSTESNLIPMHKSMNHPVFYFQVENKWAQLLKAGSGIEATVTVDFYRDEDRPTNWSVNWIEISPSGLRTPRHWNVTYLNNSRSDFTGKQQ